MREILKKKVITTTRNISAGKNCRTFLEHFFILDWQLNYFKQRKKKKGTGEVENFKVFLVKFNFRFHSKQ